MGFAAGFQVGASAVERGLKMREEDALKRSLAQEAGRYGVTEGAYGPGLQENIQQLQGLREQDPAQAAAYDQAIGELTRRQSLTAPDYSVASGPTNFATRQEARQAAAPMRAEGLAGVYRQYGDVAQADALEARAFEQQRGIAREAREVAAEADRVSRRPFELEDLQNRIAAGKLGLISTQQQIDTGALTLAQQKRVAEEQQRGSEFAAFAAERPDASVAELKEAAFKQFKFTPKQWQDTVTTRLGIENAEMDSFKNNVKKKLQGKSLTQLGSLYNSDPDFDDKTDLAIVPGKGGAVTLNFIDKATGRTTSSQSFKNEALATEYLNKQATEPETIGSWMLNLRKTEAAIDESTAGAGLKRAQTANVGQEKLSPLEKNLATLKRLGIPVTDAQVKTMALGVEKDPALAAELAAITKIASSDTANPEVLKALPGQIQDAMARSKGRETAAAVVDGLTKAQEAGRGAEAVSELRRRGMPEPAIQAAAAQAGAPYVPPAAQSQPQQQPPRGLTSGAQPAPYVPPAGSRAAIAQEARAQSTAAQAESARLAAQAQSRLATDFAADARTLSPVELVRKYDRVRGQLPRDQALELQTIQRNIR